MTWNIFGYDEYLTAYKNCFVTRSSVISVVWLRLQQMSMKYSELHKAVNAPAIHMAHLQLLGRYLSTCDSLNFGHTLHNLSLGLTFHGAIDLRHAAAGVWDFQRTETSATHWRSLISHSCKCDNVGTPSSCIQLPSLQQKSQAGPRTNAVVKNAEGNVFRNYFLRRRNQILAFGSCVSLWQQEAVFDNSWRGDMELS